MTGIHVTEWAPREGNKTKGTAGSTRGATNDKPKLGLELDGDGLGSYNNGPTTTTLALKKLVNN